MLEDFRTNVLNSMLDFTCEGWQLEACCCCHAISFDKKLCFVFCSRKGGGRANAYIHDVHVHVHLHVLTGTFLPSGPVRVILHYGVIIPNLKVQCSQFFVDLAFFKMNLN